MKNFDEYYKDHFLKKEAYLLRKKIGEPSAIAILSKSKKTKVRRKLLYFILNNYNILEEKDWVEYSTLGLFDYEKTTHQINEIPNWIKLYLESKYLFEKTKAAEFRKYGLNYILWKDAKENYLDKSVNNPSNNAVELYGFSSIEDYKDYSVKVLHRKKDFIEAAETLKNCLSTIFNDNRLNIILRKEGEIKGMLVIYHNLSAFFIGKNYIHYTEQSMRNILNHIQKFTTKCDFTDIVYDTHGKRCENEIDI